ncbi:MAG: Arm DNA-binding domain-containing protein [Rhodoplanes sp.]
MSKEANRLTAKRIERLKEPGRYHDGRGLYLQITPSGSRSWLLRTSGTVASGCWAWARCIRSA